MLTNTTSNQRFDLDALVLSEFDALLRRSSRASQPQTGPELREADQDIKPVDMTRPVAQAAGPKPAAEDRHNVIGLRRATRSPSAHVPFDAEEEAFIEQAAAFLSTRPNADLILNEIWGLSIQDDADGEADDHEAGLGDLSAARRVLSEAEIAQTRAEEGPPESRPDTAPTPLSQRQPTRPDGTKGKRSPS